MENGQCLAPADVESVIKFVTQACEKAAATKLEWKLYKALFDETDGALQQEQAGVLK